MSAMQAGDVLPPTTTSSAKVNDVVVGTATPVTSSSLVTVTPATIGATGLGVHQTPGSDAATTIVSSTTMMDSPPTMSTSGSTTFPTPRSVEREQLIIQTQFPEKNAVLPPTGSPSVQRIFREAQRAIEAEAQSAGFTDPNAMGGHDKSHTTLASSAKTETPLLAAEIPVLPIASSSSSEMPTLSTHQSQKPGVVVSTSVSSAESPALGASMPQDASVDELSEDSKPLSSESDLPEGASKKAMLTDEDSKVLKGEVAAESAVPAKELSSTSTADTTYSLDHVDFIARPLRSNLAVPPKFNVASEEVSVPTDEKEPLSAVDRPPAPKQAPGSARRPNARVLQTQESLNRLETMWKEHPARQKSLQAQQDANAVHEDKDTASNSAKPDDVPDLKPEVAVITQETALNESSQPAATRPSENETPEAATTNPEALTTSPEMPATTAEDSALFHVSPILENSGAAAKESRPPAYQTTSTTVTSMITISTPENEIVTNQSLTGSTTTWVKPTVSDQESAGIAEAPGSTSTIEPLPMPVAMIPRLSTTTTSGGIVEEAPHSFTSASAATLATRPSSSPSRDRNDIRPEPQAPTSGGSILVTRGGDSQSLTSVSLSPSSSRSHGGPAIRGRSTGLCHRSSGSANGRPLYLGERNGWYYYTSTGHRKYVKCSLEEVGRAIMQVIDGRNVDMAIATIAKFYYDSRCRDLAQMTPVWIHSSLEFRSQNGEGEFKTGEDLYYNKSSLPNTPSRRRTLEALRWYIIAAIYGHAKALCSIGNCFYYKFKAHAIAKMFYELALERGDRKVQATAKNALGNLYAYVERDFAQALDHYRESAEAGNPWGQYHYAIMCVAISTRADSINNVRAKVEDSKRILEESRFPPKARPFLEKLNTIDLCNTNQTLESIQAKLLRSLPTTLQNKLKE